MILTITGPSGVGKTTLLKNLLQVLKHTQMLESITTRAPRPTDEANFLYVTDAAFKGMEERGEFLWTVHPHGKHYATRKQTIDNALRAPGLYIAVLVIEAVQKLHAYATAPLTSLYIRIDDEKELRKRFTERGDLSREEIESRIAECRSWDAQTLTSGVPFIYLDGKKSREKLLAEALAAIQGQ